jgi:predicted Rossmann fold flavoprotein
MQGLSLKNVAMRVREASSPKIIFEDFGEMMFTHFGLTGPMVLSASSHIKDINTKKYIAEIDLKPALDDQKLDARLLSDFSKYANKDFENALCDLLPSKMIDVVVRRSGIDGRKKVNSITREERAALLRVLKHFELEISGFRPISEAIITKGGIDVKEVSPKTMASKLISGLYFAGEMLDVDAYTGGFNLQIAFSTGVLAGESAAWEMN